MEIVLSAYLVSKCINMFHIDPNAPSEKLSPKKDYTHEELLYGYERIHDYIMHNDELILTLLGFMLTFVGGVLAFIVQATMPYIDKVEIITIVTGLVAISATQTFRRVRRTMEMSTYLRKKIEPDLAHIRWENDLDQYRTVRSEKRFRIWRKKARQSLSDFQQAAVFLTYQYILTILVAVTGFYLHQFYVELEGKYDIHFGFPIDLKNMTDVQLNIALLSLLLCVGLGIDIFIKTCRLKCEVNGVIAKYWDEALKLNEKGKS